jgi:hypothetical protein
MALVAASSSDGIAVGQEQGWPPTTPAFEPMSADFLDTAPRDVASGEPFPPSHDWPAPTDNLDSEFPTANGDMSVEDEPGVEDVDGRLGEPGRPFRSPGLPGSGTGGPGMGPPGMGAPGYGVAWYPTSRVKGSGLGSELGMLRQNISARVPVWGRDADLVMLSTGVRNTLFFTDAVLPTSLRPFPNALWNLNVGSTYLHRFDNGGSSMLGVTFGSASDKPFHSINEMNVGLMSSLQVPAKNQRDMWMFMLMYSPVGNFTFPMPGVAYFWNPSEEFHASIGLPFSVMWRPTDDFTFNVSYVPLITINARATYQVAERIVAYSGFVSLQEAYLLADRENVDDRFIEFEKRVLAGMRLDLWEHATLDISSGYAFDRYFGIGQNQIGGSLDDQVNIAPCVFLAATFEVGF